MRRFLLIWGFALLIGSVQASPIIYIASLSGPSESPPNISPGTGNAIVTYDSEAHTLLVDAVFQDLTAGNTAAHIHCCTASAGSGAAGVATMTPTFAGFPTGTTSGIYDSPVFDLTQPGVWNASFITNNGGTPASAESVFGAGLADGRAYFNIHTSVFPGGEIRGFLAPIPEPTSLLLIGTGLGLIGLVAWRKRN
jgi:hypothetical protein